MLNDEADNEGKAERAESLVAAATTARDAVKPFVLALDIGTSSVRAALYDARAREIRDTQARIEHRFGMTAEGGAQWDAEELAEEVGCVIDASLARSAKPLRSDVRAVAVSCFWHSLVGVGADGRALTPVFGWADTRASRAAEELRARLDERAAHARTGCPFHPSYWPAKLLWLNQTRPDLMRDVRRWLSFGEFLAWRFAVSKTFDHACEGARVAASISMASGTGLFNQRACAWDETMLADLRRHAPDLHLHLEQLPTLTPHDDATYTLGDDYAARWPDLRGRPIFPAVADGAANNIGAGCVGRGRAALMVGTSGAMRVMYEGAPPSSLPRALWCYRADRRRVIVGGALSDGGGLYEWMMRTLVFERDAASVESELAAMDADAHGLTVLPFWAGERSTGWNADASGGMLGLRMQTRPVEILRAAMEAVAYRLAHIADALASDIAPPAAIRASGGALLSSPAWTQIIADVLGRRVELLKTKEASSRGAVLLALEALGEIKNISPGAANLSSVETYEPRPSHHARYREAIARQQKFYEMLIHRPSHA